MGRGLLRAVWPIIRTACDAVTVAGLAGFALLVALDRLPSLLSSLVAQLTPHFRLEVRAARLDGFGRLVLHDVRVSPADTPDEPLLVAKRAVIAYSPWSLRRGHLDEVQLDGVLVTPPAALPAAGDGPAAAWSIGRLVTRGARVRMPPRGDLPGVAFRVACDLRDLGTAGGLAERVHEVVVKDVLVTPAEGPPLLAMRGARVEASLAGLLDRRRIDAVRLVSPSVTFHGTLPALGGGDAEGDGPSWSVGRLVVDDGRFALPPAGDLPGVTFRVSTDQRELGTDAASAGVLREISLRRVAVGSAAGAALVTSDAVRARFTIAGLLAKRVDEVRVATPVITVPDSLPLVGGAPGGGASAGAAGWSLGRLLTYDGSVRMPPAGELPGVRGGFAFDLRELGLDPTRAALVHQVRVRDVRVRFAGQPTSLVIDDGGADFTLAGLLERRQLARVRVAQGLFVLDRPLRDRMAGGRTASARPAGGGGAGWTVGVLDLSRLGIRLSDLGPQIPDLTLFIRSRLTDVPLGPAGLAKATTPQRIELSNLTLDSPVDPFRPVIHVGSVFVEFTMAELLNQEIASLTVVSPTIYLGEDLIWYMNATRQEAAAAPAGTSWHVRHLRADLGRLVLTFNGVDRAALPLNFRTDARNVDLGDLATLRLAVALEVPRQSYTFPGFDLELVDVEGELRFDYPPGEARDNVVNTLQVAEIRWRDYRIHDGWFAATFDANGINGKLGGAAYDGYVNGGASLPFRPGPMAGWASCTDLDLEPIAATAAGSYLEMTGLIDLEGAVQVLDNRIDQARADLDFKRPGRLSFPALDRLLERLPLNTVSWQRDLARIAVETFRDYPYHDGKGTLRFADARGEAHLALDGERGKRQFDVHYYDEAPAVVDVAREGE